MQKLSANTKWQVIFIKAVILAGGIGSRLRPVTLGMPKPMARVLDVPLIGHNVRLLKKHGLTDAFVTLKYMPRAITDYLGDGSSFGMNIEYVYEKSALGTAGGVRKCYVRCREPLLVISGDAATDCDLSAFISFCEEREAVAGIAVVTGPDPLEYGSVFIGPDGRITSFSEKPSRQAVCGDMINTGIYYLSKDALEMLPESRCDFAKDVFPSLLAEKKSLYAWRSDFYWQDVGTCEALKRVNMDALDGKIYGFSAINTTGVTQPSFISENAVTENGAVIGPYAVIGEGSYVGSGAEIKNSVLCSAKVENDAFIDDSILCRGSVVGESSSVGPECVIGDHSRIGAGCCLGEGAVIWPGRSIPDGACMCGNECGYPKKFFIAFDNSGRIFGDASTLTADVAFSLGRAAASISPRILYSSSRDHASQSMAACFAAGAASSGARAALCDSSCAASLAYACMLYSSPGLFVSGASVSPTLYFYGSDGYPLERELQRKLEAGESSFNISQRGTITSFTGTDEALIAAAKRADDNSFSAKIQGLTPASRILSKIVGKEANDSPFQLSISGDGFLLSLSDAFGVKLSHAELICALAYNEIESGKNYLVLPEDAPHAALKLAREHGLMVYIRGKDQIPFEIPDKSRNGFFLASALAPLLKNANNATEIRSLLPTFSTTELDFDPGPESRFLLRRAVESKCFGECTTSNGITAEYGGGYIRIVPTIGSILQIRAECADMKAAKELAADTAELLKKLAKI